MSLFSFRGNSIIALLYTWITLCFFSSCACANWKQNIPEHIPEAVRGLFYYLKTDNTLVVCAKGHDDKTYARLSIHGFQKKLNPGEFIAKTYSENTGICEFLIKNNQLEETGNLLKDMGTFHFTPYCVL